QRKTSLPPRLHQRAWPRPSRSGDMAMDQILSINLGSTSKRYSLYFGDQEKISLHFESTPEGHSVAISIWGQTHDISICAKQFDHSLDYTLETFRFHHLVESPQNITAIGIRVVAPG